MRKERFHVNAENRCQLGSKCKFIHPVEQQYKFCSKAHIEQSEEYPCYWKHVSSAKKKGIILQCALNLKVT